jgi:hypothetical protein
VSLEGQLLDQKSLRAITGKTADWNEIAKDCIAFANATGGRLLLGDVIKRLSNKVRHIGDSWAIEDGRYARSRSINQILILINNGST